MDTQQANKPQIDLLEELGISDLPPEKQEELMTKMMEVVLKRIFVETMARLKEEDKEKYMSMIEKNMTPEEVEAFVKEKIPKYNELVLEIAKEFREEMVSG